MHRYAGLLLTLILIVTACSDQSTSSLPPEPTGPPTGEAVAGESTGAPSTESTPGAADAWVDERAELVATALQGRDITDEEVLDAMRTVPRHEFVAEDYLNQAYADHPLPIGYGQTISQPYIVALMTQVLELEPGDKVLEIGTGSGYQAAVLAEIVEEVFTIEIIGALVEQAAARLERLGYANIQVRHADGYFGWEEEAPFDAIIVTAAPDHVPPPLRAQLADGGKLVIPVGPVGGYQELWLIERTGDEFTTTSLGGVAFVPLTREEREE